MGAAYKSDVLTAMIRTELERLPRGTATALARAVNVRPQTVTKWHKGEVQPEPERWAGIEAFFGWEPGEIVRQVMPVAGFTTVELIDRLTAMVLDLAERVTALEADAPDVPPGS